MDISEQIKLLDSVESASGCWCVFVPLSSSEGVKFYHKPALRDEAARLQAHAEKFGLGPRVGDTFDMPYIKSWDRPHNWNSTPATVYGYVTELVDVDGMADEVEWEELHASLMRHGISIRDIDSRNNIGRTYDGKLVRFDFDPVFYYTGDDRTKWRTIADAE